jgi:methylphosphotriester-DNA--protein-cysteine methyltransferase
MFIVDDDPREQENPAMHALDENYDVDQMEYDWHEYGVYTNYVDIVYDDAELLNSNQKDANECSRRPDLTDRERQDVYEELLQRYHKGILKKGSTNAVADKFNIHPRTVQRVWERAKKCMEDRVAVDVSSRKPKNTGRKKVVVDLSMVTSVSLLQRSTIRSLAGAIGMSKSAVHRCYKEGLIRRHSNTLKPYLKEANKKERLQWCLYMLDPPSLPNNPKFIEMKYIIHTDEKWFNATKKDRNFYLLPNEEDPYRTVQNKNAMEKCMLLCGVGLPWFDDEGNCIFDGKVGIWPFVRKVPQLLHAVISITCPSDLFVMLTCVLYYHCRNQHKGAVITGLEGR